MQLNTPVMALLVAQATTINPRDGTAAGADRMHRDRGHAEVIVVAGRAQIGFECQQVLLHERFQRRIDGGR